MFRKGYIITGLMVLSLITLSACTKDLLKEINPGHHKEVSLMQSSYGAADVLAEQVATRVRRNDPILVGTLSDINHIGTSTPFGRIVAEQVGTRFVQLGYSVQEMKLRNDVAMQDAGQFGVQGSGEYLTSRNPHALSHSQHAAGVISGTYVVADDEIWVNLRLVSARDGRVIGAHDYRVEITDNIEELVDDDDDGGFFSGAIGND